MSLNPEDSRRRGRSRSPGARDERSRSRVDERERSRTRVPSPPASRYDDDHYDDYDRKPSKAPPRDYVRDEDDDADRYAPRDYKRSSPPRKPSYAPPGGYEQDEDDVRSKYGPQRDKDPYEKKKYYDDSPPRDRDSYDKGKKYHDDSPPSRFAETTKKTYYEETKHGKDGRKEKEKDYYEEKKYRRDSPSPIRYSEKKYRAESPPYASKYRAEGPTSPKPRYAVKSRYENVSDKEKGHSFKVSGDIDISHSHGRVSPKRGHSPSPPPLTNAGHSKYAEVKKWEYAKPEEKISYTRKPAQVLTVEPGRRRLSSVGGNSLSVAGAAVAGTSLALAPGSPLLESYHGTYQSISPMPSPLMIANAPYIPTNEVMTLDINARQRHARFHDMHDDASALARALKGTRSPDVAPLIDILPALTHEQIMDLRVEYKKIVKTGKEMKGVNIAKHIKMRLKEDDPSFMKACYATALGKWESEAYWANFWYQGEKSRRELLIESLMGRTNAEIRAIKDGFSDKKYSDSLVKCMQKELKEDKFKKAVLLVLEGRRMEEHEVDRRLMENDVRELYRAVRSEKGGETSMINIIVQRSNLHLRDVLKVYEATYRSNFAREMLKKSGNLVGELLAHILNGVINKPVRDALLLNHALSLTKSDSLRTELLISRLVRFHWDRPHMEAIKREYRARYGKDLQTAVADGTKGDWGEFCEELCVRRMGDEVRRVEFIAA